MVKKSSKASNALFPLQHAIEQLTGLFGEAQRSRNPALFLYRHDARTPLFMAESIMRLLNHLEERKKPSKGLKIFKKLEDSLGRIDYYDQLVKQFSKIRSVKEEQLDYFISARDGKLRDLNKRLLHKQFYTEIFRELSLSLLIDFNSRSLILKLEKEICKELRICYDYYMAYPQKFTELESQVHELRRKLRWISIYAHSLQGIMVLKPVVKNYKWEKELITRSSQNSPYNKLMDRKGLKKHIFLNQKAFYALGFVLNALGEIKDKGLALEAFGKMLKKTAQEKHQNFEKMTIKQLKLSYNLKEVLEEAHQLLHKFFTKYQIQKELL